MAAGLLAFFVAPYPVDGLRFPVGPDVPVYLWWARIAGAEGLSAVGLRPGAPALSLVLGGALGLTAPQVLAALGAALGAATGLAAAALVGTEHRARAGLAGALAGTFAAHLAGGYFANLALVVLLLAGAASLTHGEGRAGAMGAAGLLAAGGLTHPLFFAVGAAILALAVAPGALALLRGDRGSAAAAEAGRVGAALAGAGALAGLGLAWTVLGPGPPAADTSKDAFLRRAGLDQALRGEYLRRLGRLWAGFALPASVPLAALGLRRSAGASSFLRRLLLAWSGVTAAGIAASLATGRAPAVRFLSFAYVLPVGAAVALPWLHGRLARRSRAVALGVIGLLAALLVAGATRTWWDQRPFIQVPEARAVAAAARVASATPSGTPLVFLVDDEDPELVFLATRAGNVIRAAMPGDRVRDVRVYVGAPDRYLAGEPTLVGDRLHDAMSRLNLQDLGSERGRAVAFVLAPFDAPGVDRARSLGTEVAPGVVVLGEEPPGTAPGDEPLEPFAPWSPAWGSVAVLAVLTAAGLGWSRAAMGPGPASVALAPAFGTAALVLAGIVLDRLGARLDGTAWPAVGLALPAGGGFLAALRLQRQARRESPP